MEVPPPTPGSSHGYSLNGHSVERRERRANSIYPKAGKLDLSKGRGGLAGEGEQDSGELQDSADLGAATSHAWLRALKMWL